jgi:hypothetical protein
MRNIMNNLVLVFTMHKVGSSTVMEALRRIDRVPERGSVDNLEVITPTDKYEAVITPVRDPVARNISYLFEQHGKKFLEENFSNEMILELFFEDLYQHNNTLTWFEDVFQPLFDIDVYQYEFNKERGWSVFDNRFLLIQSEQMTGKLQDSFNAFFAGRWPKDKLHLAKTEDTRDYGKRYAEFLDWIQLPGDYLDMMYERKYVRHFYFEEQKERMRKRWAKRE